MAPAPTEPAQPEGARGGEGQLEEAHPGIPGRGSPQGQPREVQEVQRPLRGPDGVRGLAVVVRNSLRGCGSGAGGGVRALARGRGRQHGAAHIHHRVEPACGRVH